MNDLIERARYFAVGAHRGRGQKRKYRSAEDYDMHTYRVALLLDIYLPADEPNRDFAIAAAHLHDVVEDTDVHIVDIGRFFGPEVMQLVSELTDISCPLDGNRAARKRIDRLHLSGASPLGKSIKLADLIDNTLDIRENDPKFAKVYLEEKKQLLKVLKEGNQQLYEIAEYITYADHLSEVD